MKLIKIWRCFTELSAKRQGSTLVLSFEDEALDAVLGMNEADIAGENGVDAVITRLNRLFKKDSTVTKYQTFKSFMTFKRPSTMSIQAFLNEFDKRLFKAKTYSTTMSDDILAYQLLKSANLSTHHEELIKAIIQGLQYNIMKGQLKKTVSDASRQVPTKTEDIIKTRETFLTEEFNNIEIQYEYLQDTLQSEHEYPINPFRDSMNQQSAEEFESFYNKGNYRNYLQKYNHQNRQNHQTFKPRTPVPYNNRKQQ